jgi:tRNA(Arg) A34 adenosine deaminase TadA
MTDAPDNTFMQAALQQAQAAAAIGEAPIGAVIVDPATGEIVAAAHNSPIGDNDPTAHAEIMAIRMAAQKLGNYRLPGLHLYVTLEPCAMCAGAISHARIARLVYGASDEKGGAIDSGAQFFTQKTCHWRPDVVSGILAEESAEMLRSFFRERRKAKAAEKTIAP